MGTYLAPDLSTRFTAQFTAPSCLVIPNFDFLISPRPFNLRPVHQQCLIMAMCLPLRRWYHLDVRGHKILTSQRTSSCGRPRLKNRFENLTWFVNPALVTHGVES